MIRIPYGGSLSFNESKSALFNRTNGGETVPSGNAVKDFSGWFQQLIQSPFSPSQRGKKVAARQDEGVIRCFGRLEILNCVALRAVPTGSEFHREDCQFIYLPLPVRCQ